MMERVIKLHATAAEKTPGCNKIGATTMLNQAAKTSIGAAIAFFFGG